MNDLSGKEDTFNAHKTAHSLATFRIYACMITPWRQAPVSAALDMTRLVLANLCRRKETVDCVRALHLCSCLLPSGRQRTAWHHLGCRVPPDQEPQLGPKAGFGPAGESLLTQNTREREDRS